MKTHTTLETSQKLQEWGCEIESEMWWNWKCNDGGKWILHDRKIDIYPYGTEFLPAHSYYSILVTHAKEFFGEEKIKLEPVDKEKWEGGWEFHKRVMLKLGFEHSSYVILSLLQAGKRRFKRLCFN